MLNTERIHTMIKINRYEEGPKRHNLKINGMFRSDYIGMALVKNFFCVTIGYLIMLAIYVLYHLEYFMEHWFKEDLYGLIGDIFLIYLVLLAVYSGLVYIICTVRYQKMKKYIKAYDGELKKLEELYFQNARGEEE